jgi:threonine synthase
MSKPHYVDEETGTRYELDEPIWRSREGNSLSVSRLSGIDKSEIDTSLRSIWRYRAALPVDINEPVTLGEGCTPLVSFRTESGTCSLKLEWFAPTGSFKDRGASVLISYLHQLGIREIVEDSSGNGGAAIAAYGAAAGMRVKVLVPSHAQPSKIAQIAAYGAEVELVQGARELIEQEALRQADTLFYASHNWHPFFLQGTKTLGYELWEDLDFKIPHNIIIPTGAGSNVLGCDLAFQELLAAGQIDTLPRLFAVQPKNCAPIDAHFHDDIKNNSDMRFAATIAEGAAIKNPARLKSVLNAVRRSGGSTLWASEQEIVNAVRELGSGGIYVEPTSALALAAFHKLIASNRISSNEHTVLLLTGTGLKATDFMSEEFLVN